MINFCVVYFFLLDKQLSTSSFLSFLLTKTKRVWCIVNTLQIEGGGEPDTIINFFSEFSYQQYCV